MPRKTAVKTARKKPLAASYRLGMMTSMTTTPPLLSSLDNGILTLTLNRPAVRNALDVALLEALEETLLDLMGNATVRVVILKGAGEAFMAGGDIKQLSTIADGPNPAMVFSQLLDRVNRLAQLMRDVPQPLIACVQGACVGFGLSLMLACDLAIAADTAKFKLGYNHLGLSPDGGVSWQLLHTIGLKRTAELALLGDDIEASVAENWGLVNFVVPSAELDESALKMAQRIRNSAGEAMMRTKQLVKLAADLQFAPQLHAEAESFLQLVSNSDFAEGIKAFIEKREPKFK